MSTKRRIDFDLFKLPEQKTVSGGVANDGAFAFASESRALDDLLLLVADRYEVWWVSEGEWNMHQLLLGLLKITGPAAVMISSYAMGETPARILAQLKTEGMITQISCLLDSRIDVRSPSSLQLIRNISDGFALVMTHAKVTLISNKEWSITVVGSANYTENKRFETGVITCDINPYTLNETWIQKAFQDAAYK